MKRTIVVGGMILVAVIALQLLLNFGFGFGKGGGSGVGSGTASGKSDAKSSADTTVNARDKPEASQTKLLVQKIVVITKKNFAYQIDGAGDYDFEDLKKKVRELPPTAEIDYSSLEDKPDTYSIVKKLVDSRQHK